ncbi:MAG: galactokinase [Planctomycetota bacterium]
MRRELEQFFLEVHGTGGGEPVFCFAPGRVNLIGSHTDYNLGPVMPIALDRGTLVAVRPRRDGRVVLSSREYGRPLGQDESTGWHVYPLGLVRVLEEVCGEDLGGFDLAVCGNLPVGAGLSSSASLLVACVRALNQVFRLGLRPLEEALLAHRTETEQVGVACGIMDPMACALASEREALFLDCRDRSYVQVPLPSDGLRVAVIDSGTRRELSTSKYNVRVGECREAVRLLARERPGLESLREVSVDDLKTLGGGLAENVRMRAEHVVREIARVFTFRDALQRGDVETCGELISASHRSLRDLYQASLGPIDALVERLLNLPEVLGARLTGAGWGGCLVALLREDASARLEREVGPWYQETFGLTASFYVLGGKGDRKGTESA